MKRRIYTQGARARAAEDTAAGIVDAFLARLMKQGFDEITLELVAADAGVTVQTIVRRFGGKAGLLEAASRLWARRSMHGGRYRPAPSRRWSTCWSRITSRRGTW